MTTIYIYSMWTYSRKIMFHVCASILCSTCTLTVCLDFICACLVYTIYVFYCLVKFDETNKPLLLIINAMVAGYLITQGAMAYATIVSTLAAQNSLVWIPKGLSLRVPLLLTSFKFKCQRECIITSPVKCGMKLLVHPQLQRFNRWSLGMDK